MTDWHEAWGEPADDALWIRQSTVGSWELCPARVMLSDGHELPSEAMSFGTLVHEMLALDLEHGAGLPWTYSQTADLWSSLVADEYGVDLGELAAEETIESSAMEAIGAVQLWRRQVEPDLPSTEPLVEARLEAPLGILDNGRQVWMHGTGDVLYPDVPVGYDWKTAGRGWGEGKAMFLGQPSAYTYLAWWNHDVFIADWRYWVYDRRAAKWVLHSTQRTPQQVQAWLRHAFGIAKAIDAGAVYYTPVDSTFGKMKRGWWCSPQYCGVWDRCKGKHLADEVDESQSVEVAWV